MYFFKRFILVFIFLEISCSSINKGTALGIEIAVFDDDGNGRKSLLTWTGIRNDYWVKMDKYGKLILE